MKIRKKVEIVTDSLDVAEVIALLDEIGVSGYTIINNVEGKGGRGLRIGDGLTDMLRNTYIMVVCNDKDVYRIVEAISPIRKKFGGICIVSDVVVISGNVPDVR
ncbi:MAG: transcriptional regulator [Candidatus Brocadiaceae bacterium]|nr:transcriptional regulator [Candidatus Brocadiaceae bacterium]